MDASGDNVTNQEGDSPVDDVILEDTPAADDGQDEDEQHSSVNKRQRKRKKKNQSLREMVDACMQAHTHTHVRTHGEVFYSKVSNMFMFCV